MTSGKIYESSSLASAADERIKSYRSLKQQITSLKSSLMKIANLGEELQGNGATNIKAFYKEQSSIADQWLNLIDACISFFENISISMESKNLDKNTDVYVDFLNESVQTGLKNADNMIDQQQDALKTIFNQVSDIISLSVFSKEAFKNDIEHAEKKRADTIANVNEFDSSQLKDYKELETFYTALSNSINALQEATGSNGKASPLYYDAKKYHSSKAYKVQKETDQKAINYTKEKREEAKAHEIQKQQEKLKEQLKYGTYDSFPVAPLQASGKNASSSSNKYTSDSLGPVTGILKEHVKERYIVQNKQGDLYANALGFEAKAGTLAGGSLGFTTIKSGFESQQEAWENEYFKEEASISMASAEVSAKANMDEIEIGAEATLAKYDGGITIPLPFTDDGLYVGGSAALGQVGGSVKGGKSGFKIHLPVGPGVGLFGVGFEIGFK